MQRLRNTFQRSRTPTGADMKMQSSLDVPKTVRSASFDEIQLEAKRLEGGPAPAGGGDAAGEASTSGSLLRVPLVGGQRSKSFDGAGGHYVSPPPSASTTGAEEGGAFLEVPARSRFQRRRSSGERTVACIHCALLEEWRRDPLPAPPPLPCSPVGDSDDSDSDSDVGDDEDDDDDDVASLPPESPPPWPGPEDVVVPACGIRVTLSTSPASPEQERPPTPPPVAPVRRRSIQRQEALFVEPAAEVATLMPQSSSSIEYASDATSEGSDAVLGPPQPPTTLAPGVEGGAGGPGGLLVRDFYLAVPELKRDRAASVDSCFINKTPAGGKAEEVVQTSNLEPCLGPRSTLEPPPPPGTLRSRSVDIVLPTDEQARYKALAMAAPAPPAAPVPLTRRAVGAEGAQREFRATPDWAESAVNGDHLWSPTTQSGDMCYVGEPECTKHGPRYKCAACKIVAHQSCVAVLLDRLRFTCKATFRDVGVRAYREQASTAVTHHWVHRRSQKGKCRQCGKSFQSKLSFSSKEIVALSCSWCKTSYHNKEACFNLTRIGEECTLGSHKNIVVPPSWIVKLPRRGSFKSSLRKSPKKKGSSKKKSKDKPEKEPRAFVIKPIPTANVKPVIVFINPKSGGNQGVKLLQKFQWHLNPRQVFDLTQGGPKMGLEMFRKVPNLRVLACGGDGTVGWVLSVLDQLAFHPSPAVGVLPLGTGNDLARALGWGGGYTDEPISKILSNIGNSETVLLDRWQLKVEKNADAKEKGDGKEQLPLSVVNNYFSMGVDAHIALEFHEAREAHPERFNSRLRNKMFYGQMGGKDLVRRKWKGLAELVTLECDGHDLTPKLKEHRVHAIVFLNIPSYGGGTHPWNRTAFGIEQATDDGLIEVVGLTTYQLPLLQAGGHGTCIAQCRTARIVTSKTIPMQVDGEACKLEPSVITLSLLNQATMLAKRRGGRPQTQESTQEPRKYSVLRISMPDYEKHHYDKEKLVAAAGAMGEVEVCCAADLEQVRGLISKLDNAPADWCFVDSCTAERFFRVDRAQEHLHYLMDIATDQLFILEEVAEAAEASGGSGGSGAATKDVSRETSQETSQEVSQEVLSPSDDQSTSDRASPDPLTDDRELAPTPAPGGAGAASMGLAAPGHGHTHASYTPVYSADGIPHHAGADPVAGSSRTQQKLFGLNYVKYSHILEKSSEEVLKASRENDLRKLRDLHQQGFSMLSIDAVGQTALHISARADHRDIVKYLLANAPPSVVDIPDTERGQTALHVAAAAGRRSVCCLLVAAGASLIVKDRQGRTAKQLARAAGDETLADYLESQERFHLVADDVETIV